jgi:hypothetical protein
MLLTPYRRGRDFGRVSQRAGSAKSFIDGGSDRRAGGVVQNRCSRPKASDAAHVRATEKTIRAEPAQ